MTKIQWTDATWNPVVGCSPVSPGCLNCYAASMAHRGMTPAHQGLTVVRGGRAVFGGTVRTLPDKLTEPLRWRKPRRVFVCSMSDLFHEAVPEAFIADVFEVMRRCPHHTFQVLTKRPERMAELAPREPLPNVWLGTSAENQATLTERLPHLQRCPAAVRFLSLEPLLEDVSLDGCLKGQRVDDCYNAESAQEWLDAHGIDWVIVGGESGPKARPCYDDWIRSVVEQCRTASVPCFVKQMGSRFSLGDVGDPEAWPDEKQVDWETGRVHLRDRKGGDPSEWPEDLRVREWPQEVQRGA